MMMVLDKPGLAEVWGEFESLTDKAVIMYQLLRTAPKSVFEGNGACACVCVSVCARIGA